MTFRLRKTAWARLGKFAIDVDAKIQGVVEHGLNLVFMEMGLPPLVEDDPMLPKTLEIKAEREAQDREHPRATAKKPTPIEKPAAQDDANNAPEPKEPQAIDGHDQQAEAV
jgi:hypothetical protein